MRQNLLFQIVLDMNLLMLLKINIVQTAVILWNQKHDKIKSLEEKQEIEILQQKYKMIWEH